MRTHIVFIECGQRGAEQECEGAVGKGERGEWEPDGTGGGFPEVLCLGADVGVQSGMSALWFEGRTGQGGGAEYTRGASSG